MAVFFYVRTSMDRIEAVNQLTHQATQKILSPTGYSINILLAHQGDCEKQCFAKRETFPILLTSQRHFYELPSKLFFYH